MMYYIFVEFLVVVNFVMLKHCLYHVKNFVVVMNVVSASWWIRITQWLHVYDVKSRLTNGRHGVGGKEGSSLKRRNANN